jgi:hypothetical protein
MFMHIHGIGEETALAQTIRNALDKTSTPKPSTSGISQSVISLDTGLIEKIIGHQGQAGGGVFKITIGRKGVKADGVNLNASMGLNTWAAFTGTNDHARVAGDVAMTAREVNPVIQAFRDGGINISAVHNHMLNEQPRIFFLHYWGAGQLENLAMTVHRAFNKLREM